MKVVPKQRVLNRSSNKETSQGRVVCRIGGFRRCDVLKLESLDKLKEIQKQFLESVGRVRTYVVIGFAKTFDCVCSDCFIPECWAEEFQGIVNVNFCPP